MAPLDQESPGSSPGGATGDAIGAWLRSRFCIFRRGGRGHVCPCHGSRERRVLQTGLGLTGGAAFDLASSPVAFSGSLPCAWHNFSQKSSQIMVRHEGRTVVALKPEGPTGRSLCRNSRRPVAMRSNFMIVLALLSTVTSSLLVAPCIAAQSVVGAEQIATNDNRRSAGRLRGGVLTLRLEVRSGLLQPEEGDGPGVPALAFAEVGRKLQVPGPLIRVLQGTEIRVSLRNPFRDSTL